MDRRDVFHPDDNEAGESETQTRDNWDSRDRGTYKQIPNPATGDIITPSGMQIRTLIIYGMSFL